MNKLEQLAYINNILYLHQNDALCETDKVEKGIISIPTGGGKTFLEAAIIAKDIIENDGFRLYVVNAPRIMLSYQLLFELYGFLQKLEIDARYMGVHSGRDVDIADL